MRPPRRDEVAAITALVVACDIDEYGIPDFTEADLRAEWAWPRFQLERDTRIVTAPDGAVVGYGRAWERPSAEFDGALFVHPAHAGHGIADRLLSFMEDRARPDATRGQPVTLAVPTASVNRFKRALLVRHGFARVRMFLRMSIDLTAGFSPPRWPEGFEPRSIRRPDDDAAVHATLQDAFAEHFRHAPEPLDEWARRNLAHEHFAPDLSFIVHHQEEAAGAVTNYLTPNHGWVGMLGVRRPWRGRGVAKALLLHSFEAFRRAGQAMVGLGVDSENADGATRLYERAGMGVDQQHELFLKVIHPGQTLPEPPAFSSDSR